MSIPVRDRLARPFDTVKLVEKGVCCVRPLDVAGTKRTASARDEHQVQHRVVLAEPLVVEAVMRAFSWQELGSGTMEGAVCDRAEGQGGFGYDPYFRLPDGRPLATLSAADKNAISHRGAALATLRTWLAQRGPRG